ncbi:SPOR domain-containing protein [Helicobacter sp. MIT 21-1697]|uniref:SPOR domain-containing protein n=1 Tax=Helicobacter sp. MIT 21-1697 TaxID=2993733 RepID=UPI00224B0F55|nr:SPOR domain-containing protein [Helicobacter sp. MIT 21-1697]MCX2716785.1 SPOR domain-containing protein [Helicobacter sp. MIT 21-1697]
METKRELNDILINDDELQKQNRTKKLMMMIATALVFLSILIAVIFVLTRDEEELDERHTASNSGLTPIDSQNDTLHSNPQDSFVDIPLANSESSEDPFQQILNDIRSRDPKNANTQQNTQTQVAQNQPQTPAPSKEVEKPTQPVLPPKSTTQPAQKISDSPKKPANTATTREPAKPTQPVLAQPTQTNKPEPTKPEQNPAPTKPVTAQNQPQTPAPKNVANVFEDVSVTRMDTSKNGQVAEKGFYVQVGSFANKPSADFLKKISNYSYRVYAGTSNGQPTTKYLIGPYHSRTDAGRDLPKFTTLVSNPVHFEVK